MVELVDGDIRQVTLADERVPRRAHRAARPRPRRARAASSRTSRGGRTPSASRTSSSSCGCAAVVTVGATADAVPHTRLPLVVGSTAVRRAGRPAGARGADVPGDHRARRRAPRRAGARRRSRRSRCASACRTTSATPSTRWPSAALLRHLAHVLGDPDRRRPRRDDRALGRRSTTRRSPTTSSCRPTSAMLETDYDRRAEATLARRRRPGGAVRGVPPRAGRRSVRLDDVAFSRRRRRRPWSCRR